MAIETGIIRNHILSHGVSGDRARTTCPACGPERKKKGDRSLSVKIDGEDAVYHCHHCEESGVVNLFALENGFSGKVDEPEVIHQVHEPASDLSDAQSAWLEGRGISRETVDKCGIVSQEMYIRQRNGKVPCVGWQYKNADGSVATKYRDGAKNFTQAGAARSLWRIDDWSGGDLVITEGEMDAVSFAEAGIWATSVPNGAPSSPSKDDDGKKYSYLWDAKSKLDEASRIILATDNDEPGRILAEEIARRVGKARCWRASYPEGCKDANDVLSRHGPDGLVSSLKDATPWPVSGLRNASEYRDSVVSIWDKGVESGKSVGIPEMDRLFRACPQTLTITTGIPGSGKSAWLTWLSVQLAVRSGWRCAVFSAETSTEIFLLQLAACYTKTPYFGENKMSEEDLSVALDWIQDKYVFLDEADTHIDSVLERAQAAVLRNGIRVLIVDPYNFLTGSMDDGPSAINRMLVSLKAFAVSHDIAVFLCAHPVKMYRQSDGTVPVPTGYDVLGSSSFFNVADSGITLSRVGHGSSLMTCWKSRFPWIGQPGQAELLFDPDTGCFSQDAITFGDDWDDFDSI